jgi:hypothetical protein
VTFLRLRGSDWVAFVAALGLLLSMSFLWYSTHQADECRRAERAQTAPTFGGPQNAELNGKVKSDARRCEARYDKTAWSLPSFVDAVILLVLLTAIACAVVAAFLRAAERRLEFERTPSEIAAYAGAAGTLLILYRVLQPPGLNDAAVVKPAAVVGLVLCGILAIASRSAAAAERDAEAAGAQPPSAEQRAADPSPAEPDAPAGPSEPAPTA